MTESLSRALDHIRWMSALLVVLHHARLHTIGSYGPDLERDPLSKLFYFVTGLGHEAVIVFFVISGILVGGKYIQDRPTLGKYVIDRLTRIWAVAIPALIFSMLVAWLSIWIFGRFYGGASDCRPDALGFIQNAAFLHKAFFPTLCSNGPYWSIHNEVWYYFLFPLAFVWRKPVCAALLVAGVAALVLFDPLDSHNTLTRFPIWLAGALVLLPIRLRVPLPILVAVFVGSMLAARGLKLNDPLSDYLVCAALIALLLGIKNARPIRWNGERLAAFSFSLYLTHGPVLYLIRTAVGGEIRGINSASISLIAVHTLASVVVAYGFYLLFERHTGAVRRYVKHLVDAPGSLKPIRSVQAEQRDGRVGVQRQRRA